jgi:peptidoglycan/LPS O-acetylase OafA/YrhL
VEVHDDDGPRVKGPAPLPEEPVWRPGAHVPALDGLRGVAIACVMLYHQTLIGESPSALDRAFAWLPLGGWAGVDLFFVLSGFLITGILLDSRGEPGYYRSFYARRALRILPLYYAVAAFSFLVLPHLGHPRAERFAAVAADQGWYWLLLSNVPIALAGAFRHGVMDVSWSLAIEEQFYLAWPLVVAWVPRRRLAGLCAALAALSLLWRTGALLLGAGPVAVLVLTPGRLDGLAVGALVAVAARSPGGLARLRAWSGPAALGAAAVLAAVAAGGGLDPLRPAMQTAGYSAFVVLAGALLVNTLAAPRGSALARTLERAPLVALGRYSYALYLFHLPVRAAIRDALLARGWPLTVAGSYLPAQLAFYAVATAATLALAWASWHLLEKRFLALRRFAGGAPLPARGAAPAGTLPAAG